ncbi:tail fiber assembly protein, partial [Escherichia coli]|uniref:tail fiber assembly protein n=1 Tax=Escherichia coli TaxID=562 RepID=UPI001F4B99E6
RVCWSGCWLIVGEKRWAVYATEEETPLLEAWKKYRVLLNRVDTSTAQDIEWPALP